MSADLATAENLTEAEKELRRKRNFGSQALCDGSARGLLRNAETTHGCDGGRRETGSKDLFLPSPSYTPFPLPISLRLLMVWEHLIDMGLTSAVM